MSVASSYYNETRFLLLGSHRGLYDVLNVWQGNWDLLCVFVCQSVSLSHVQFGFSSFTLADIIWHGPWNSPSSNLHANGLFEVEKIKKKPHGQHEQTDKELCNRMEELDSVFVSLHALWLRIDPRSTHLMGL